MKTCEAGTVGFRLAPSGFGMERIPCTQQVGLRSFTDAQGDERFHCSIEGHRYQVERRFGVAQPVEPDWDLPEGADPITAGKGWQENERRFSWGDR